MLIVKKYGGSSVSTPEKILEIAKRLKSFHDQGHKLIIIVSAMGDTTDDLVALSRRITVTPIQREMDMLLSAGERISMSLMSMALNSLGCEAISFTGSQSGVFTDNSHNNARITDIRAVRVKEELEKGRVVIIAGFQGVDPQTKEITTLGRGGSDTTAVAMAAAFKADRCDILTDVRGIYSVDPRIAGVVPRQLPYLDYELTMEMAYWGARVLHYRSVELAERTKIPILVHLSSEEGSGTLVKSMEHTEIRAINHNASVACLCFDKTYTVAHALEAIRETLREKKLPIPQIFWQRATAQGLEFFVSAPTENFEALNRGLQDWASRHKLETPTLTTQWATVTVNGRGLVNSDVIFEGSRCLEDQAIPVEGVIVTPLSVSYVISETDVQKASRVLHTRFIEGQNLSTSSVTSGRTSL